MTEVEWLACTDPTPMLEYLRAKATERKLRLFACACCWEIWYLLRDKRSKKAAKTIELYADGLITDSRMADVREAARRAAIKWVSPEAITVGQRFPEEVAYSATLQEAGQAASEAAYLAAQVSEAEARELGRLARQQSQCRLLRYIFGNPFRPVTVNPAWLTPKVTTLAQSIYADRAFDKMPELADALQEAGCTNEDILSHCREPGPHVRGCWVVDLVLGKE